MSDDPRDKVRELIGNTISDLVSNFLYYDRKEDEDLPRGVLEHHVADGTVTVDEIIEWFTDALREGLDKDVDED